MRFQRAKNSLPLAHRDEFEELAITKKKLLPKNQGGKIQDEFAEMAQELLDKNLKQHLATKSKSATSHAEEIAAKVAESTAAIKKKAVKKKPAQKKAVDKKTEK